MPRLYSCVLAFYAAITVNAGKLHGRADSTSCPGVNYADETTSACCVGGTIAPVYLSVCDGWPICDGPTTTTTTSTPLSCATLIAFSDSNYLSEVSAAEASMEASGTTFCTTIGIGGNKCEGTQATATGDSGTTTTKAKDKSTATKTSASSTATGTKDSGSTSKTADGTASGTAGSESTTASSSTTSATATPTGGADAPGKGLGTWALGLVAAGPVVVAALM